ncbi:retrovirus-related pol polyprotein from transposon TNT 1-94 [Tanacetum coccineum]
MHDQEGNDSIYKDVNTAGTSINTANANINARSLNINNVSPNDQSMPSLEETDIFDNVYDDREVGAEADINNLELSIVVSPIPTTRIHKDHPKDQIIRDLNLATQTRRMINFSKEHAMTLVDLPKGKRAIGTKWVYRNKKEERGIVVRNKARLMAQGYTQEEGIDYHEVFAPVARIEAIMLFLAYASFMGFIMYQMNVKSTFLYSTITKEVYVCQPPGFEYPQFPDKVYKVEKALYGLHQAFRAVALIEGRMIAMNWRCFLDEIKVNTGISKISTARIGKAVWLDLFLTFIHGLCINMDPHEFSHVYLVVSSVLVMNRGMLYALTKNPTIYVSLIENFWQTATVKTHDNREQEINATVDGKEFTIIETSVRRHL